MNSSDRPLTRSEHYHFALSLWLIAMTVALITMCSCRATYPEVVQDQSRARVVIATVCAEVVPSKKDVSLTYWVGSGVIVGENKVLTAAHVVSCSGYGAPIEIMLRAPAFDITQSARVEYMDRRNDIARLSVETPYVGAPTPDIAPPSAGESLCVEIAHPVAGRTCGYLVSIGPIKGEGGALLDLVYSFPSVHGNSGSPVYDAHGRLVGLMTHGWPPPIGAGAGPSLASHPDIMGSTAR